MPNSNTNSGKSSAELMFPRNAKSIFDRIMTGKNSYKGKAKINSKKIQVILQNISKWENYTKVVKRLKDGL